jgi:hypothetical protein
MSLSRDDIVDHLRQIVGNEQVLTDEHLLQQRSIDNFRKLQNIFGVYTMAGGRGHRAAPTKRRSAEFAAAVSMCGAQVERPLRAAQTPVRTRS